MLEILLTLFFAALYVLQALGLQTIAKRRGIPYAWLAWLPLGDLWILASIADDFVRRTGGKWKRLRVPAVVLSAVSTVLVVLVLVGLLYTVRFSVGQVLTADELLKLYGIELTDSVSDLYDSKETLSLEEIYLKAEEGMTDEQVQIMLVGSVTCLAATGIMVLVRLGTVALEYLCLYRLFASCEPERKTLYLLVAVMPQIMRLLFPVVPDMTPVLIFFCRNKDLGLPENAV